MTLYYDKVDDKNYILCNDKFYIVSGSKSTCVGPTPDVIHRLEEVVVPK